MPNQELFESAFLYTLANEGHTVTNDPRDHGGLTAYGITQRVYSHYLGRDASETDMRDITVAKARDVYRKIFWEPLHARIPDAADGVLVALFDQSVHAGAPAATALAQKALGTVSVDGKLGPLTAAALTAVPADRFLHAFVSQVSMRYARLVAKDVTQVGFLEGWLARASRMLLLCPARDVLTA